MIVIVIVVGIVVGISGWVGTREVVGGLVVVIVFLIVVVDICQLIVVGGLWLCPC